MGKKKNKTKNPPPKQNASNNTTAPLFVFGSENQHKKSGSEGGFVFGTNNQTKPLFDFSVNNNRTPFNLGQNQQTHSESEDDDDEYYTDDDDDDEDYLMQQLLLQQLMMEKLGIRSREVCPCCGEEMHGDEDDEDDEDDDDDEDVDDDDEEDEDDEDSDIYNKDNSPFSRVFGLVTKELKEKKLKSKKEVKQIKSRGVVIEDITESEDAKKDDFLQSDVVEGFFSTMEDETLKSVITKTSVTLSNDPCSLENSIFYRTCMNALRPLFADVRKFILIQGLRKRSNNPKLNIRPSTPGFLQYLSDYEIHPSKEYMEYIVERAFVPKSQQPTSYSVLNRQDIVYSAKSTIMSKKKRRDYLEKEGKRFDPFLFDVNHFSNSEEPEFDVDPNDPETRGITDELELERMREYKTDGARMKRIRIGNWSPNACYDGQFRIKVNPHRQTLSYTFFTYTPLYHNNFQSAEERMIHFPTLKSAVSENGLRGFIIREFERLKTSVVLSMEINFKQITGIHFQKCDVDPKVMPKPLSLLVLDIISPPYFYTRRVSCDDATRNEWVQRSDFTTNKQASMYLRHYIMGDERELSRILALILLSDSTKNLTNLYNNGMKVISMSSIPTRNPQKSKIRDIKLASLLTRVNLATPKDESAVLNADIYENLCLKKALSQYNIFTLEKLFTLTVGQLLEDVNLTVPGLSKKELDSLEVHQVIFHEKFKAAGIYFSFCKGRFFKESECGHSLARGECCTLNTEASRLASFNPTKTLHLKPAPNPQTNPFYTEDDQRSYQAKAEGYNELSSPFFFEDKKSVKFYKP